MTARKVACLTVIAGKVTARVAPELGGDTGAAQLAEAVTGTRDKNEGEK